MNPKQIKRYNTVSKLVGANPNKYCFADLSQMAVEEDRETRLDYKESAKNMRLCREDFKNTGCCWCNQFNQDNPMPIEEEINESK
jgi:hypothetical protein